MKRFLIFLLIVTLYNCSKDETVKTDDNMWQPNPIAYINDQSVQLFWHNAVYYRTSYCDIYFPYVYVEPDEFDIYLSKETMDNFKKYVEIKNGGVYNYTFNNLENGKPYYFYIVAKKWGYQNLPSDTIMAIPDFKAEYEELVTYDYSHTIVNVAVASKINKIAYVDLYYSWYGGENCCSQVSILISNLDGSQSELLDISGYEPRWSPNNDKIVFRTENVEIIHGYGLPCQLAMYDYNTKEITRLTDNTFYNYSPVFSENGELILFQSNNNNSTVYTNDIWLLNLVTYQSTQITNIKEANLIEASKPEWIDNDRFLFQGRAGDYRAHIYESSIATMKITQTLKSNWNEYCPSISPDKKKIAFISDRSGNNQLWMYNNESKDYKQLTGFSTTEYLDETWCRIQWFSNTEIIFTFGRNQLVKLRVD